MSRLTTLACMTTLFLAFPARAQLGDLFDKAKKKAQEAAEKAADEAARGAPEEAPPEERPTKQPARPAQTPEERSAPAGKGSPASAAPPAGEVYGNRYDFVPGDKVLVYDDFGDTDVGEYPAKWTVKAIEGHNPGGGNAVEVVGQGGRRFLKSRFTKGEIQEWTLQFLRYAVKGDMPRDFTIEFDADIAGGISAVFSNLRGWGGQEVQVNIDQHGGADTAHSKGRVPSTRGVQHVAIAVSGTQVKLYVGGERVLADPDGVERPITRLGIMFERPDEEGADHQMFTAYRLAEGGKPAKQMLAGEGKIVTHGILFDTGSDVIRPESGPTLRAILQLLQEDPKLRFSVEGHTDDQGGPGVNQPLSERRAAAVRAWLVKQGVDGGRLTTKGFGQSKPIDKNATAEGRANNRRVEFVRI